MKFSTILFSLLSPTWLLARYAKVRWDRTRVIEILNTTYLWLGIISAFGILIYQEGVNANYEYMRGLNKVLPQAVLYLWGYFLLSRCNEIFLAFVSDVFDRLGHHSPKSFLSPRDRIRLSLKSYLELIINFSILYALMPEGNDFWQGGNGPVLITEAIYFSGVTITTLGYGDISPSHWFPQLLAIYQVLSGFLLIIVCFAIYAREPTPPTSPDRSNEVFEPAKVNPRLFKSKYTIEILLLRFWKQHPVLVIGSITSVLLLIIFLGFQFFESKVLMLESRWLIVAGVPVLIALLIGGYIKSFKGFGVELQTNLNKSVTRLHLVATEAIQHERADEKRELQYIERMSNSERRRIDRLILYQGRPNYYAAFALQRYLDLLKGIRFLEIRNSDRKFVGLLPVSEFKRRGEDHEFLNDFAIQEFIQFLENSEIEPHYSMNLITDFVNEDAGLIESLKAMRRKKISYLVVLDENENVLGVISIRAVEKKIVDEVLAASESAN